MKNISEYENREEIEERMEVLELLLHEATPCNCKNNPPCNICILQNELDDLTEEIDNDDAFQRKCEAEINAGRYR